MFGFYHKNDKSKGGNSEYDFKVDYWAIGVLIYELWLKHLPFEKIKEFSV